MRALWALPIATAISARWRVLFHYSPTASDKPASAASVGRRNRSGLWATFQKSTPWLRPRRRHHSTVDSQNPASGAGPGRGSQAPPQHASATPHSAVRIRRLRHIDHSRRSAGRKRERPRQPYCQPRPAAKGLRPKAALTQWWVPPPTTECLDGILTRAMVARSELGHGFAQRKRASATDQSVQCDRETHPASGPRNATNGATESSQ
jgi:hypothetical protein